ncbi:NAD(P)-dependent oxidoreductase [Fulvivirgaceae bacterium BMA12]|uniref:NAD(P)-dependent oxidoreductase n=1 Tax=Agaribacillus aureus TaxID=3051825 RepID=A0ABT8LCF1_9BACT|nr:NAD(P)-dependent oxidoreductase [Fulvivirgaceae bacterium BMA12]
MKKGCLIVDELHTSIIANLESLGFEVSYRPDIQRREILEVIGDYEGVIVRSKLFLDKEFFNAARRLKFIARAGAGLDQIDVEEVEKRQITIVNAPEGNRDALAEHCVGMILCLLNKIHLANNQIAAGEWHREVNRGVELAGKAIGIIGYGYMGEAFAKRLSGFGCNVLAYDKYKTGFSDGFIREASLQKIFEECDIVSFHVPLTEETKDMVNAAFIANFKKNIYIVNTARGEILPLDNLKVQLLNGKVIGAALDVHEFEKKPSLSPDETALFDFFKTAENVLLTPHVGGWTHESYEKISRILFEKISRLSI